MPEQVPESSGRIQDTLKTFARLPLAMSLFGVDRAIGALSSNDRTSGGAAGPEAIDTVTKAVVDQFSDSLRTTFQVGDRVQRQIIDSVFRFLPQVAPSQSPQGQSPQTQATGDAAGSSVRNQTSLLPIFDARSLSREEVIVSFTRGQGRFSEDRKFITLDNKIYLLDGRECGIHQGVWECQFNSAQELMARPDSPSPPLNQPVGPVQKGIIAAQTKAVWAFEDGEVFSVGPAASHLVPLDDGSFLFLVSTAQVVTHGTGRFTGVYGLTQSLGATHVPRGVDLFSGQNRPFPAATLDTFKLRVVRGATSRTTAPTVPIGPDNSAASPHPGSQATSPNSKFVDVHKSRMHYVDVGAGETILFLHGNPAWSYLWRNVIPEVSKMARCIAPDLIGMGRSEKPDIAYRFVDHVKYLDGFIAALGLKNITLVLHDWGCLLGFYHALKNSQNIRAMAFMEATFRPYRTWNDFPEPLRETFQAFRTPDVGYERIVVKNEFIEQLLPRTIMRKLTDAEMDMFRMPFRNPADRKVIWKFASELPIEGKPADVVKAVSDYGQWLKTCPHPKLLLYAEPGAITTRKDVQWARNNLRNLTTVSVGNGIHFLQEDNPEAIARELVKWHSALERIPK